MRKTIKLVGGDARLFLPEYHDVAFCFLDAEKDIFSECYKVITLRLVKGGLLVADNAMNLRETLQTMLNGALTDVRVGVLIVPIDNGLLICRKI